MTAKNLAPGNTGTDSVKHEHGFPVPLTVERFRDDLLLLYVQQMRTLAWMTNKPANVWKILEKAPLDPNDIYCPDLLISDLELTYEDIVNTTFAKCFESMYQYAYFGILDESFEPMEFGTAYTMLSAIVCDMFQSLFLLEWESFGGEVDSSCARRCLTVAELANARRVLEGYENFSYFFGINANAKDEGLPEDGALTIRQMALLAGMEEMSIRAAANPKRTTSLATFSEQGRTRVAIDEAKKWLKVKGRYVPVTRQWNTGDIDLTRRSFSSLSDLNSVIHDRRRFVAARKIGNDSIEQPAGTLAQALNDFENFEIGFFSNSDQVAQLAAGLEFPVDLFCLRVREALAKIELAAVERDLRERGIAQRHE